MISAPNAATKRLYFILKNIDMTKTILEICKKKKGQTSELERDIESPYSDVCYMLCASG